MAITLLFAALLLFTPMMSFESLAQTTETSGSPVVDSFINIISGDSAKRQEAYDFIEENWQDSFTPLLIELIYLNPDLRFNVILVDLLEEKTHQDFGFQFHQWYSWLWKKDPDPHPDFADFKSALYGLIDPKFAEYFSGERAAKIRLDEVRWGGVVQDGIPPLRSPKMIAAQDATYLDDENVVFGIAINGDTRAYPKRILAWHEMFVDTVGGEPVTGVYCTLCGTMILYKSTHNGKVYQLGTSGFLYRSNKLMYDKDTQSLWNTLWGRPVIGPLADKEIALERLSVVTTTWGEWVNRHPRTKVLSLETGFDRDYGEGVAYRDYFATDDLMFNVPELDDRLKNKAEVLGLVLSQKPGQPLAIASEFLRQKPIYHDAIDDFRFVVLTDRSGAHRVYEAMDVRFMEWDQKTLVRDTQSTIWQLDENFLESTADGKKLYRLASHRAFWFGWYAAYKHTRLVK